MRRLALLPCAAGWLLSGCAGLTPPVVSPPAVPSVTGWQQPQPVTSGLAPGASRSANVGPWWAQLGDAALESLVATALRDAPDLHLAQARLREVRARRDATAAGQAPSLSGGASASRSRTGGTSGSGRSTGLFDLGFDARWEADLFGQVQAGVSAAEADAAASAASLADVQLSLAAEVVRLYTTVRQLQLRLAAAQGSLARQADTLQITRWRAQAGLVSQLDVVQAEASLAQTRAQAAALVASQASAALQLELLLGRAPGALAGLTAPSAAGPTSTTATAQGIAPGAAAPAAAVAPALPVLPATLALALPADVLRQRPDVRLAEAQWRAEAARTRQAQAAQFPSLSLSGSLGLQALTLGALGQGGYASLASAVTAPLFDGGRLRAQLAGQVAVQDRFAIAYQRAMLAALSEVEDALATLDANRRQAAALDQAATAARQAAALSRLRYRSGLVDFRTVLDAERSVLSSEDSLASAQAGTVTAWAQLHKALGSGAVVEAARAPAGGDEPPAPPTPRPEPLAASTS